MFGFLFPLAFLFYLQRIQYVSRYQNMTASMGFEPHAKETVIDDVGSMILIYELTLRQAFQRSLHTAERRQTILVDEAQITQFFLIYANYL